MEKCRRVGTRLRARPFDYRRAFQIDYSEVKSMHTTWKPHEKHGELTERSDLPDSVFAFPKERKEPLTDASHVRNAIARFDQTIGVSDEDRELAFANIKKAAEYYGVDMTEKNWK